LQHWYQRRQQLLVRDEDQRALRCQDRHPVDIQGGIVLVEPNPAADDHHGVADGVQLGVLAGPEDVLDGQRVEPQELRRGGESRPFSAR